MDKLVFQILFEYEVIPNSIQVELCAEIEMVVRYRVIVKSIKRPGSAESSLLPELHLTKVEGKWRHSDNSKESNISRVIGESIDSYLNGKHEKNSPHRFEET